MIRKRRWQKSPVTGESTKETVKTIAQGRPGYSGEPVVTTLVCLFQFACEAAGATGTRLSLRPLFFEAKDFAKTRAHSAAGTGTYEHRHCEERSDEAIHSFCGSMDCFAEPVIGRRFARPGGSQ
jgi:hypothetical protein